MNRRCRSSGSKAFKQSRHHAAVNGTEHGVVGGGLPKGARLGDHGGLALGALCTSGKTMGGEGLGDGGHGGADGPWSFSGPHLGGETFPVVLSDGSRHCLGLLRAEKFQRTLEQGDKEIVSTRTHLNAEVIIGHGESLGRSTDAGRLQRRLDGDVGPCDEPIEMVANHIWVKVEYRS